MAILKGCMLCKPLYTAFLNDSISETEKDTCLLRVSGKGGGKECGCTRTPQGAHGDAAAVSTLHSCAILGVARPTALQTLPLGDLKSQDCFLQAQESALLSKGEG